MISSKINLIKPEPPPNRTLTLGPVLSEIEGFNCTYRQHIIRKRFSSQLYFCVFRYSSGSKYTLQVRASDNGSPQKSSDYTINVQVVNSPRPPRFKFKTYDFTANEVTEPGTKVGSGVQIDYSQVGAFLKYSFVDGNKDNTFCIDGYGQMYLARRLDREKVSSYQLKVRVEFEESSDETTVNVVVQDYNDDPPHFDQSVYELKVAENTSK